MDDIRAVMGAIGSERAAIIGESEGVPLAMLFAVVHPERTRALILTVGSGIELEDRGVHELKGVPGPWQLWSVA